MTKKKNTDIDIDIKNIYDEIIKSQIMEKEMYKELETYKTSKEKTIEIVRQINAYVIQRRKLISNIRTACYEECGECEKKEKNDDPPKYTKLKRSAVYGNNIKKFRRKSRKSCKKACDKDIDCKGFNYKNVRNWRKRRCMLKHKIGKIRRHRRFTFYLKEEEDVSDDELIEICSEFEKTMDEEESLNQMKNELTKRINLTLPLESNTLKAVFLNTYSDNYYSSLANITYL